MLPSFHPRHLLRRWPERRPFDPSLVAYYSSVLGSGSVLYDESLYGNHGTIYGATWAEGKIRPALSFDGVDDYVEVPYSSVLDVENELSLEAWIYSSVAFPLYASIVGKFSYNIWCLLCDPAKRPRINVTLTNNYSYAAIVLSDLSLNRWYHIVGTFKRNDKLRIYLNGVEVASIPVPDYPLKTDTYKVGVGYIAGGNAYFNGIIDEVRIYNRALSEAEILRKYLRLA